MDNFLHIAGALAVMLLVIFSAYYVTRIVALRAGTGFGKTRYMKLLDRFGISRDKTVVLIAVGQTAYLLGITNQSVSLIDTVALSDLIPGKQEGVSGGMHAHSQSEAPEPSFRSFLSQVKGSMKYYGGFSGTEGSRKSGDENDDGE